MAVKRPLGDKETILCWRPHAGRLFQFTTGGNAAGPRGGMTRNQLWMQLLDLATAHHARPITLPRSRSVLAAKVTLGPYWFGSVI